MIFEHLLKLITLVRRKKNKNKKSKFNLNHINHIRKKEIANSELCRCANKAKKVNPKGLTRVVSPLALAPKIRIKHQV
jgi:hypothetical protein